MWLRLGAGAFLAIELVAGSTGSPPVSGRSDGPGWHCVALAIEANEREAFRERLATAGFPVERETSFTLYTRDPEQNLVALSHHPETAPTPLDVVPVKS